MNSDNLNEDFKLKVSGLTEIAHKHPFLRFLKVFLKDSPTNTYELKNRTYRNKGVALSLQKFIFWSSTQERKSR